MQHTARRAAPLIAMLLSTWMPWPHAASAQAAAPGSNPIIRDKFTADPAPLVAGDRLYLYVGHDQAQRDEMFNMREWLVYSTTDMTTWTDHGPIMKVADFTWAKAVAWASQAIEKNGRFWFYAAVEHDATHPGKAIAVAVSDSPTGPFVDAKGSALITNEMTHHQADSLRRMVNVMEIALARPGDFRADNGTIVHVNDDGSWHRPHAE